MNPEVAPALAIGIVLFFGIGLHEYAHCKFADLAGDPTPRYYGRVTLNLTKHFEITGVLMMIFSSLSGFGIGWGKSSPSDPSKMRNPRWDFFISVIAGPISNILQALLYATTFRFIINAPFLIAAQSNATDYFMVLLLVEGVRVNLALCLFNLIPFGPLDGHWLLGLLLPEPTRTQWFQFNRRIGFAGLFAVVLILQFTHTSLLTGPIEHLYRLLTGELGQAAMGR